MTKPRQPATKKPAAGLPPPPPKVAQSNLEAVQTGDLVVAIQTLCVTLAEMVDVSPATVVAQVAAQYRAALSDWREMTGWKPGDNGDGQSTQPQSKRDELRTRREGRVAKTATA